MNLLRVLYKSIFKHGTRGYHHGHRFGGHFHHDMPEEFYRQIMMHRRHFHHHWHDRHAMWSQQRPTIQVNEDHCTGCGKCVRHCHHGVLSITTNDNQKRCATVQHADHCVGCGHCLQACRFGAITFENKQQA